MDKLSQEEFDRLLKLNPEELTPQEAAFLNARRSYLTNDQKRIFADVLHAHQEQLEAETEEEGNKPTLPEEPEYTRRDLEAIATDLGIEDVSTNAFRTKADLQAAIDQKRAEKAQIV